MSKRVDLESLEHSPRLEGTLEALFVAATPDAAFVAGLERQLVARAGPHPAGESPLRRFWARWAQPFGQRRWAMIATGLLLIAAVALAAVGPQRVLAEIQRLLGYVPGVGFVDLESTRLLAAPVEVTRNGVTLRVEQVLAGPDRTVVVVRSEGLPSRDQLWPKGPMEPGDFRPQLRLPDGRTLTTQEWALCLGAGTLEFPSLPDDVYRVTLELPRLPLVPPDAAPEDWTVSLALRPATGELAAELFPQPYAPVDASDTHHGITLRVLEVAHSPEETVLHLQVAWLDPDWEWPCLGGNRSPQLRDELDQVYHEGLPPGVGSTAGLVVERIAVDTDVTPAPTPQIPTPEERTLAFAPASPSAQHLTLWVDAIQFEVPAEDSFIVDLGEHLQIGDRWPLDVHLTVAGFPVHITGARLVKERFRPFDDSAPDTELEFDIAPVPDQGDRELRHIHLNGHVAGFSGSGSGWNFERGLRANLSLNEGDLIPTDLIQVQVESAGVLFRGPWNVAWTVPGADEVSEVEAVSLTLHPENASQTHVGLTLRVEQAILTDRLTAVMVKGDSPSPDVTIGWDSPSLAGPFNWILEWRPVTRSSGGQPPEKDLYLEDDRGRRYEYTWEVGWQPRDGQTSEVSQTSEVWTSPISFSNSSSTRACMS